VNLLSEDGTAALATSAFSRDGKFFAYGVSRSVRSLMLRPRPAADAAQGSDFCTIYVRSKDAPLVQTGDKRPSHDDDRLPGA
jgi:prolyl oligopeptidase